MSIDFATDDLIRQLRQQETDIPEKLLHRIHQSGPLMIEPLLQLALDREIMHEFVIASNAPVHALRLLGEIGDTRIITPLLRATPMTTSKDEERDPAWIWDNDLPQMLARLGAAAIEPLWDFADAADESEDGRATALLALAFLAVYDSEQRENIVEGMTTRFRQEQDREHASALLVAIANLGISELYPEVIAGYQAKRFDSQIIHASTARQLLLNKGSKALACVNHTLSERYTHHPVFGLE